MPAHKNCSTYVSSSFTTANVRVCFNSNCAFVSLSLASLNNKPMFLPFTFVTCAELQKVRPMMPLLPAASYHRVHTFPYLTLGSQSLKRKEDHSELILQKYTPPEAQQLHQKSHQKTNVTTSISLLACNEPHFFTWVEHN
jgi:hypothetical protein